MNKSAEVRKRALRMAAAFSRSVKSELALRGKTMAWISRVIGVSRSDVSCQLSGKLPLSMTSMAKYEKALGITFLIVFSLEKERGLEG